MLSDINFESAASHILEPKSLYLKLLADSILRLGFWSIHDLGHFDLSDRYLFQWRARILAWNDPTNTTLGRKVCESFQKGHGSRIEDLSDNNTLFTHLTRQGCVCDPKGVSKDLVIGFKARATVPKTLCGDRNKSSHIVGKDGIG